MKGINKVILVGTLGKDPEMRKTQGGYTATNISIATTEAWTDREDKKQTQTEWHKVVFWGRLAEIAGEYLKKGSKVYIEGRIRTRKWQDKDNNNRYTTEIIAHDMQMLDSKVVPGKISLDELDEKNAPWTEETAAPASKFDFSSNDEIPF